jgi:hypothetical protein
MNPDPHGLVAAQAPHRPAKPTDCGDRDAAERRHAAAVLGVSTRPAPTPVAVRPAGPTVRHTLRGEDGTSGCPAAQQSAPCLCVGGRR